MTKLPSRTRIWAFEIIALALLLTLSLANRECSRYGSAGSCKYCHPGDALQVLQHKNICLSNSASFLQDKFIQNCMAYDLRFRCLECRDGYQLSESSTYCKAVSTVVAGCASLDEDGNCLECKWNQ